MTERLEPLKLKRRIIKALARRSSGFSESPPPFFHPAPPTYIFFPPFFPPPPPPTVLFLVSFPLVLFLFFSLSFLFYFFIFLHFLHPFSLSFSLSRFRHHVRGQVARRCNLPFVFPRALAEVLKHRNATACNRVQGWPVVDERTVPFYRATSPSRGTLIGKVGKIVGELSHARFDGIMHTVSALSRNGNNEDLEFLAVSFLLNTSIAWKILFKIKSEIKQCLIFFKIVSRYL